MVSSEDLTPYCDCLGKCPGYLSLRDPLNTFVCGLCYRPSLAVYLASEKACEECGCSIYTRWSVLCQSCQTEILALCHDLAADGAMPQDMPYGRNGAILDVFWTWKKMAEMSKQTWPYHWSPNEIS